jgi:hypothetical protein
VCPGLAATLLASKRTRKVSHVKRYGSYTIHVRVNRFLTSTVMNSQTNNVRALPRDVCSLSGFAEKVATAHK